MTTYYLQDILNECNVPEKFTKPEIFKASDTTGRNSLIVDFGSWQCRVGMSHESFPSSNVLS